MNVNDNQTDNLDPSAMALAKLDDARIIGARADGSSLVVGLSNGVVARIPLYKYPWIRRLTPGQLRRFSIAEDGSAITLLSARRTISLAELLTLPAMRRRSAHRADDARREATSLYLAGRSLDAVAKELGVSRSRVQQYLVDEGLLMRHHGGRGGDPVAILRAVRSPAVESIAEVARQTGHSTQTVEAVLGAMELADAARRLFRLRRRAMLLRGLSTAAEQLGRTPTSDDMNAGRVGLKWPSTYRSVFGSVSAALRGAGLEPRARGKWASRT